MRLAHITAANNVLGQSIITPHAFATFGITVASLNAVIPDADENVDAPTPTSPHHSTPSLFLSYTTARPHSYSPCSHRHRTPGVWFDVHSSPAAP